jgi:hypothetical protein
MRSRARRFRGSLLIAALVIGAGAPLAVAQELQLDPKALDVSGAAASATAKRKGKKSDAAAPQADGKPQAGGPNRQFGELEGWSPGKAPPKPKDKYDPEPTAGKKEGGMPVGMSPSGNMSVGLPF